MDRRPDTFPLILLFAIPGILGPLTVPLLDYFMGLATLPQILAAFTIELVLEPLLVAVVGVALAAFITRRVRRAGENPQAAYRAVRWGWLGVMVWGIAHNLAFSLVFHAEAAFITDAVGTAIVAIYAAAVGMFFSVITVVGALPIWERRLPVDDAASGKGRSLGMGARFFLSITITVVAFLYGTSAVVLFAVYAGHDTAFALARISLVGIPFLLITIPLVAFLARTTTGTIAKAVPVLTTFSGGDLRPRLETRGVDEISLALHHVNRFVDSVGASLGEATVGAAESARLASGLDEQAARQREATATVSARVEDVSSQVAEVQRKVDSVASATEEITRTLENLQRLIGNQRAAVEETSSSAEQLSSATSNVVEVSERRRSAAEELSRTVSGSVGELSGAMTTMESISSRADNLRSLNEVIADLAARTNLLAMNAAIEAAHAGDAGRGFAVVASEIRSLAESASRSAAESTSFLDDMVRGIEASASAMRRVQGSFRQVDEETASVVGSLQEIVTAAGQMRRSAGSIGSMMIDLSEVNREVVDGAGQIGEGVLEINRAGQSTRELAGAAATAMAAVAEELSRVAGSSDEVARIAGTLRSSAEALEERLRRYRLGEDG